MGAGRQCCGSCAAVVHDGGGEVTMHPTAHLTHSAPAPALLFCDVQVSIFAMHRNPKYWSNPEAYIPERFVEGSPEAAEVGGCGFWEQGAAWLD